MPKYRKGTLDELKYNFPINNDIAKKIYSIYGCKSFAICKQLYFNNFYFNDLKKYDSEEEYRQVIEKINKVRELLVEDTNE